MQLKRGTHRAAKGETTLPVNPYNPCLPDPHPAICSNDVPIGSTAWRPFATTDAALLGAKLPFTVDGSDPPGWDAAHPDYWQLTPVPDAL